MKKPIILFALALTLILGSGPAGAANRKLSFQLGRLADNYKSFGVKNAKKLAIKKNINISQDNTIEVVLELNEPGSLTENSLRPHNAKIKGRYRNFVKVSVPLENLESVAEDFSQVQYVRLPLKPHTVQESQGVVLTGANLFHGDLFKGAGTKIAIIDAGFMTYAAAQAHGDLPATLYTHDYGTGVASTTNHGTAVAEIVYDMAPEAELHLMKISDDIDLGQAKDDCKSLGIDIANHSVVWFNSGPGDGTGYICDIVADAYNNGILWVNSAGNSGQKHWMGAFADTNNNGRHEFSPADDTNTLYANAGSYIEVCLRWDDSWYNSDQDYDLWLMNAAGTMVECSERSQNGSGSSHPTEEISYLVTASGNYNVVIVTNTVTSNHNMELFSIYHNFEYIVSTGSICEPADSDKVLAVGAMAWQNWDAGPLEQFSSKGPTIDGRTKPDISGPDGTDSYTYGGF